MQKSAGRVLVLIYIYLMFCSFFFSFFFGAILDTSDGGVGVCFLCRRVPKLPWRWKTAKWLTAQHRLNTWGQRWVTHRQNAHFSSLRHTNSAFAHYLLRRPSHKTRLSFKLFTANSFIPSFSIHCMLDNAFSAASRQPALFPSFLSFPSLKEHLFMLN